MRGKEAKATKSETRAAKPETRAQAVETEPSNSSNRLIPLVLFAVIFAVLGFQYFGAIDLSGFLNQESGNYLNLHNVFHPTTGPKQQNPVEFQMPPNPGHVNDSEDDTKPIIIDTQSGTVGEQYNNKINAFADGKAGDFKFEIFDEMTGLPPPGITLSSDGTLSGVPTKAGNFEFQVCASDKDDKGDCFYLRIHIAPKKENVTPTPPPKNCTFCPTTSCQSGNCCCTTNNSIRVSAVLTYDCCPRCPDDTHQAGTDAITAGGPYKICQCNKC